MNVHAVGDDVPKSAWLVSKMGRLTTGVQYESQCNFLGHYSLTWFPW